MQSNKINKEDLLLIQNKSISTDFGGVNDFAELHIYQNNNLVKSNYNFTNFKPSDDFGLIDNKMQSLLVNPENNLKDMGFDVGEYNLIYNFFRKLSNNDFFIKEISSSRSEIILSSNILNNDEIEIIFNKIKDYFEKYSYLKNILVNFSKNKSYVVLNIALDLSKSNYDLIIKTYEPLDSSIGIKSLCLFCEEVIPTHTVKFSINPKVEIEPIKYLSSPNFNLEVDEKMSFSTDYKNTEGLVNNLLIDDSKKSLDNKSTISLNINYETFEDFVHYSNVEQRILNFIVKIKKLEKFKGNIANNIGNVNINKIKIEEVVSTFDGYEYFLYNSTSSKAYPKLNGNLLTSSNIIVTNWLGSSEYGNRNGILGEAVKFDEDNLESIKNSLPLYILEDENNEPFIIYCNMIGQHFDELWLRTKKFTDIYNSSNNQYLGISPDIVENVLKSFGVKLYNSLSNVDLSNTNYKKYNKEIYKRIFHNLPYLNKSKGTKNSIIQLMNIFGVPDTIFRIYEYGDETKKVNSMKHIDNIFSYALTSNRQGYLDIPFKNPITNETPKSTIFRLKLNSKRVGNQVVRGDFDMNDFSNNDFFVENTETDYSEEIGYLKLFKTKILSIFCETFNNDSSSIYLVDNLGRKSNPITVNMYNGEWKTFELKRIVGINANIVTYKLKCGEIINGRIRVSETNLRLTDATSINGSNLSLILGYNIDFNLQKLIQYSEDIDAQTFISHTLNPTSIQGNSIDSFSNKILYYIPFGLDLKTYNHSNYNLIPSLIDNGGFYDSQVTMYNFENKINYTSDYSKAYYNGKNSVDSRITDTIKISDSTHYKKVLSRFTKIKQDENFVDYGLIDIAFSPTFEQDDDIISTLGYFNLDDYIGNPKDYDKVSYVKLKELKNLYTKKLIGSYNINDYLNILKYVDNSLFKMIRDFIPYNVNSNIGIVYRQNILSRNKISQPIPTNVIDDDFYIDFLTNDFEQFLIDEQNIDIDYAKVFSNCNFSKYKKFKKSDSIIDIDNYFFTQNSVIDESLFDTKKSTFSNLLKKGFVLKSLDENKYNVSDISLDKSPNFESYLTKIGLFTEIYKSDIFDKKSIIQLRYLVDRKGNLTDLNQLNKNVYDIQNLFPNEKKLVVSLFDNTKYSNQKTLDGSKKINNSAIDLQNTFYFTNKDKYFKFNSLDEELSTTMRYYQFEDVDVTNLKYVYDLFNSKDVDLSNGYTVGNSSQKTFSKFIIPENGQYDFNVDLSLGIKSTNEILDFECKLSLYKNYIDVDSLVESVIYSYRPSETLYDSDGNPYKIDALNEIKRPIEIPIPNTESMVSFNNYWSKSKNSKVSSSYVIPFVENRNWVWDEKIRVDSNLRNYRIYVSDDTDKFETGKLYEVLDSNENVIKLEDIYYDFDEDIINIRLPESSYQNKFIEGVSNSFVIEQIGNGFLLHNPDVKNGTNNTFVKGDSVIPVFEIMSINDKNNETLKLLKSSSIYSIKNNFNLKLDSSDSIIKKITTDYILLNTKLSSYLNKGTFDLSSSTLFKTYGEVDNVFSLSVGDLIIIKDGKTNSKYIFEISTISITKNKFELRFTTQIPSYLLKENITECLFVNKTKDETKVIIDFNKKDGQTSYGFLIPDNLHPNFLSNIDVITKEVKQKILNDLTINKINN